MNGSPSFPPFPRELSSQGSEEADQFSASHSPRDQPDSPHQPHASKAPLSHSAYLPAPGDDDSDSDDVPQDDHVCVQRGDLLMFLVASNYTTVAQQVAVLRSLATYLAATSRPADKHRSDKGRKRVKKADC